MAIRSVSGLDFHYNERGHGTPLVLLHGFPLDSRMWDAQLSELSTGWRTIAPDLRGFGKSESRDPFTIESLADDVHALLAAIGALPCIVAGLSMGGYISLAFVRKYAADLRGLILVDTKAEADSPQQKEGRQKMIDLVRSKGSKAIAEEMLPKLLAEDTLRSRPAQVKAMRTMTEACPPLTIEHALIAMRDRPDHSALLPSIELPTLIIVGEHDAITPVSVARSMQKQIPHAQLAPIKGAGHMSPLEQPAQVSQVIGRFMSQFKQSSP